MTLTVKFSNQVRDWIVHNLGRGVAAQDIAAELVTRKTDPELAAAMVHAVMQALRHGTPLPDGQLVLRTGTAQAAGAAGAPAHRAGSYAAAAHAAGPCAHPGEPPDYRAEPLRLPAGPVLRAADREVRVLARMARPAAALLADLMDTGECKALIAAARPRLERNQVVDPVTGLDVVRDHRNSHGMFFRAAETPLVARLERRIAQLTGLPAENGEGLLIQHYPAGAQSTPHYDHLMATNQANRESVARSGQRVATLIVYLNEVADGGETTFPHAGWSVVPQRGHALYFEYTNAAGHSDPVSLHAGAPVLAGEKWIATKWLRSRRFVPRGG